MAIKGGVYVFSPTGSKARRFAALPVTQIANQVMKEEGLALRLGAQLMSGCVRVYSFQFQKLSDKARQSQCEFAKKQRDLRSKNSVTLPRYRQTASDAAITQPLDDIGTEYLFAGGSFDTQVCICRCTHFPSARSTISARGE